MKTTQVEQKKLNDFTNNLSGEEWKGLALAQYQISRQQGLSHQEAMKAVYNKIVEVSTTKINRRLSQTTAKINSCGQKKRLKS